MQIRFFQILVLAMLLAGCQNMQNKPPDEPQNVSPEQTGNTVERSEGILEYANRFMSLPREAQKAELALVNQRLAENRHDLNDRTKAVIIYLLADSAEVKDSAKAQSLLDDLAREDDPDAERKALVKILRGFLMEQTKISRENSRLNLKMHEEQKRVEALQQKLEELKQIEKNIVDRKVLDK